MTTTLKAWEITEPGLYLDDRPNSCYWMIPFSYGEMSNTMCFRPEGDWHFGVYSPEIFKTKTNSGINYSFNFTKIM